MKIIDERKRCDARYAAMKWSNSEMQLRQRKISIIIIRDNENNSRKEEKKTKTKKNKGLAQAIMKVWELNDFVVSLS